jgi:hypothetical protein
MPKPKLSVSSELGTLQDAVEAIELLAVGGRDHTITSEEACRTTEALAQLVSTRIRDLRLAMLGHIDPGYLIAHHNIAPVDLDPEQPDLILTPWSRHRRGGRGR